MTFFLAFVVVVPCSRRRSSLRRTGRIQAVDKNKEINTTDSHVAALKESIRLGFSRVMIFEDDARFRGEIGSDRHAQLSVFIAHVTSFLIKSTAMK